MGVFVLIFTSRALAFLRQMRSFFSPNEKRQKQMRTIPDNGPMQKGFEKELKLPDLNFLSYELNSDNITFGVF